MTTLSLPNTPTANAPLGRRGARALESLLFIFSIFGAAIRVAGALEARTAPRRQDLVTLGIEGVTLVPSR